MRDLVETVIGQVLNKDATYGQPKQTPHKPGAFKQVMQTMNHKEAPMVVQGVEIKDKALWQASVKFEAMLFQQMMAAMRKTVPKDGLLKQGFAQDVQQSMFDQAVADAAGQQGSLGLAMNIYRQMEQEAGSKGKQAVIQEARQAADSENKAKFLSLKGELHGTH